MVTRLEKFESFANHPWYHKVYKRLKQPDLALARDFIREHDRLDHNEFEKAVNRMFMDKAKPKLWTSIIELIAAANTINGK